MADLIAGRCLCGAVRFQFDQRPIAARACWCRDCQYLSSGNASVNAIFRTESLRVTGNTSEYVSTADSGNVMRRRFCPKCGTPLFSEALSRPDLVVVRAGTLDDPEIGRPASFIWTASAPSWGFVEPGFAPLRRSTRGDLPEIESRSCNGLSKELIRRPDVIPAAIRPHQPARVAGRSLA